jgi:4-amino-4-deoxy-L-arabinose transferase-like glycosyltransferase
MKAEAEEVGVHQVIGTSGPRSRILLLLIIWIGVFAASLFSPPLLDDADATHAEAAQAMLRTGDWVTLHVDGVRYLEKPPLPYWIAAISLRIFGQNAFAIHLPMALAVLGLALLAFVWGKELLGERLGFNAGLAVLTSAGVFLFTRIFIPEALLSLLLAAELYCTLRALRPLEPRSALFARAMWISIALAVLTKGLIAIVFPVGATAVYLGISGEWRNWRKLQPISGVVLLLAIAAPWHILAGLRNTGGADGHGFFWFYFINEHVLRFLGRRIPRDYNKLPGYLYWSLHLVWLFPWSLFAPAAMVEGWRNRRNLLMPCNEMHRAISLLVTFSALLLLFFSLSTNQEYYTFPAYFPLLLFITLALLRAEGTQDPALRRVVRFSHAAFAVFGCSTAAALTYCLWTSRHLPYVADIGGLLDRRGVGNYTLSMSHFFDLTGASFAALRLPAALAALALAAGPAAAWWLRVRSKHAASTISVALTSAVFLIAAHIALVRFSSMLSSQDFAQRILDLKRSAQVSADMQILLYGDQAYGSSIPFYLQQQVILVDGRSSSMLFGSTFSDAPPVFETHSELVDSWGRGPRKVLFVPQEKRDEVDALLGQRQILLKETSGKALITDRPLNAPQPH